MKRLFSVIFLLALAITLTLPVTADASAESDSMAWFGSRVSTSLAVSGTANYYQYPSTQSSSSNPSLGTISSPYISAIGKNGSGVWYYQISAGGVTAYAQASSFTPNYDAAGYFYFNFLDSNGGVVSPTSSGEYSFVNTSRMHAMVRNAGGDAVTVDTLSIVVKDSSGTQITGGTVSPGTTGSYEITENSSLASQVDFSRLSVGTVYTMTVTATFTNHYHPSSSTSVTNRSFTKTFSSNIRVTQGQVSVTTSGLRVPTANMTYGEKYTLKGTITATGANLSAVSAYVYRASDTNYSNNLTGTYDLVNAPSYSIQGSKLDNNCKFGSLEPGDYVYVLRAEAGGQGFLLNETSFRVLNPSYTITYYYNNNSGNIFATQAKARNASIQISEETPPAEDGYVFLGWDTNMNGTTVVYRPGDSYSENNDLNLYAVWDMNTYTLTYNSSGGSEVPASQTRGMNPFVISSIIPERYGYQFLGWTRKNSAVSDTNPLFQPGAILESAGQNQTLYARWEVSIYYTVIFEPNGGEGSVQTLSKPYNHPVGSKTMFSRPGYDFVGWAYSPDASKEEIIKDPNGLYTYGYYVENADATLYAVWEKAETVTWTICIATWFDRQDVQTLEDGSTNNDMIRHWGYESFDGSECLSIGGANLSLETINLTTTDVGKPSGFANWSMVHEGSLVSVNPWNISTWLPEYQENIMSNLYWTYLNWDGNPELLGFFTNVNGENVEITPDMNADHSMEIRPFWSFNSTCVVYDGNGGTDVPIPGVKKNGESFVLSASAPVREGYRFVGWATASEATEPQYQPGDVYTSDEDLVLYAVWELVEYESKLVLPAEVTTVDEKAFAGVPVEQVTFPDTIQTIGNKAFLGCDTLRLAVIPVASVDISFNAFDGCEDLIICAPAGGTVEAFARGYGFNFIPKQ